MALNLVTHYAAEAFKYTPVKAVYNAGLCFITSCLTDKIVETFHAFKKAIPETSPLSSKIVKFASFSATLTVTAVVSYYFPVAPISVGKATLIALGSFFIYIYGLDCIEGPAMAVVLGSLSGAISTYNRTAGKVALLGLYAINSLVQFYRAENPADEVLANEERILSAKADFSLKGFSGGDERAVHRYTNRTYLCDYMQQEAYVKKQQALPETIQTILTDLKGVKDPFPDHARQFLTNTALASDDDLKQLCLNDAIFVIKELECIQSAIGLYLKIETESSNDLEGNELQHLKTQFEALYGAEVLRSDMKRIEKLEQFIEDVKDQSTQRQVLRDHERGDFVLEPGGDFDFQQNVVFIVLREDDSSLPNQPADKSVLRLWDTQFKKLAQ